MDQELVFNSINDKLPRVSAVVDDIFRYATSPSSGIMKVMINRYAKQLIDLWVKSFGAVHVLSINSVKKKLGDIVKGYWNQVYNKGHRKTNKNLSDDPVPICQITKR